jgi:regulator-associated protein of mTOR
LLDTADGIVRLYRNYDTSLDQGPVQMVSAFRGLNEVIQMRQGSGVVLDWKQSGGTLLVGGDSRVIKVWDAHTEIQGLVS